MKVFLKKIVLISAAFIFLSLTACAKPSKKTSESKPVNPEILKLNKVLLQMSDRCKQAIPNGDPEEFWQIFIGFWIQKRIFLPKI